MEYIIVLLMFVGYILYERWIKKISKVEEEKREEAYKSLEPIVKNEEEKYNIKKGNFFSKRVMSIFLELKKEEEKEDLRGKLIEKIEMATLEPGKYLLLNASKMFVFVIIMYAIYYLMPLASNGFMVLLAIWLTATTFAIKKNWLMMFLFIAITYYIYPKLYGTIIFFIILNRIWAIIMHINKKNENKQEKVEEKE
jgi:Flp pilus assembly protein TadB